MKIKWQNKRKKKDKNKKRKRNNKKKMKYGKVKLNPNIYLNQKERSSEKNHKK